MRAAYVSAFNSDDPVAALQLGELEPEAVPADWVRVRVRAASLNRHDLFSLAGVGLKAEHLPMVIGCDAAGATDDGREVVVYPVITSPGWLGDPTLDPRRSLLSERYFGTLAQYVQVPAHNVVPKPDSMSWEQAACMPTAWLTAYRMIFSQSGAKPGDTVLVQGGGGGVATALVILAAAAGMRVWVTSRSGSTREQIEAVGRSYGTVTAFDSGARLPERVDAVFESVGAATWSHSIKSMRPGATLVICGATTGDAPQSAELTRIFFQQMRVQGSTMGTRDELQQLLAMCSFHEIEPVIDRVCEFEDVRSGLAAMAKGDLFGKVAVRL